MQERLSQQTFFVAGSTASSAPPHTAPLQLLAQIRFPVVNMPLSNRADGLRLHSSS